jgi:tripeptidyl-peptidase-1
MLVFGLLLISTLVGCNPLGRRAMSVHERRSAVPTGFIPAGPVSPTTPLTLRIALTNSNIDELEKVVYEISNPASVKYGKHLTKEQVHNTPFIPSSQL